jgi:uncharacterized SAM-dependent methyltransferase
VHVNNRDFYFDIDETILTEYSHKYSLNGFAGLAALAGWHVQQVWTDEQELFSVQYLTVD